jgi:PAS domain S-box-containing protein
MISSTTLLALILALISEIIVLVLLFKDTSNSGLKIAFITLILESVFCCTGQILQITLSDKFNVSPIIFDNITYVGVVFMPVSVFAIGYIFAHKNPSLRAYHFALLIIPIISIVVLWTNDYHHLFYKSYSIYLPETEFGTYFRIHSIYSYILIGIGLIYLISMSIRNTGLFSKQSLLILIGSSVPVIANIFATFGILKSTIYITPITFSVAIICYVIAIYRFNFLKITPIALKVVVNTMSDGYIILNDENTIVDYNNAFLDFFGINKQDIMNKNLFTLNKLINNESKTALKICIEKAEKNNLKYICELYFETIDKYFQVECSAISQNDTYLGTLILFKDISQHKKDMNIIQNNQEMLIEKERLASLGQMIGGIAHNLKTPIFSISGGLEGLSDLIKEYDSSIEDPTVTDEDMHDIAKDMNTWIIKLKEHISYMSDVITAVKGQAVTLSEENVQDFNVDELFKYIDILMKHELKNSLTTLNIENLVDNNIMIKGNINGLVQVINNLISNAIDAYEGAPNKEINLKAELKNKKKILITIKDFGPGLPENVKSKLFKEMITTKGKNGTGLGLFMSYSNIKAHFNGNLYFETADGKGTTFFIELPI